METCRLYVLYAQKGASEAPRTHSRACKISKFSGDVPPDPPCNLYYRPHFLYLTWAPPILSAALLTTRRRNTLPKDIKLSANSFSSSTAGWFLSSSRNCLSSCLGQQRDNVLLYKIQMQLFCVSV